MAKNKKELTPKQKQIRYRIGEKVAHYSEYLSIAIPYIIMGAVNFEEWFKSTEGWKVGLGGSLAIGLMCIAWYSIVKKSDTETSRTGGLVKVLIAWMAIAFILLLLADIIHQIWVIMMFGGLGIAGALGLEITSNTLKGKADDYNDEIKKANKEQIRKEVHKNEETKTESESEGEDTVDLT